MCITDAIGEHNMPYIPKEDRPQLAIPLEDVSGMIMKPGELNYVVSLLIKNEHPLLFTKFTINQCTKNLSNQLYYQ